METEKKENLLSKYMDERGINLTQFAQIAKMPVSVVHAIYHGTRSPRKATVLKIKKATKGEISLEDFGFK